MGAYCTYFDRAFVDRGLTLVASIRRHDPEARVHVLAMGRETRQQVLAFDPAAHLHDLDSLEACDPDLVEARSGTSWREYIDILRPSFLLAVLDALPPGESLTYMDADLLQLAPPGASLDGLAQAPVLLTPHDYPPHLAHLHPFGTFNSGWVAVRNDDAGRGVLEEWRRRCLQGCGFDAARGHAGNQTHLDPMLAEGFPLAATGYPGVNLGPWSHRVAALRPHPGGAWTLEGRPLVSFHFSGLVPGGAGRYYPQVRRFGIDLARSPLRGLYRQYVEQLAEARRRLAAHGWEPPVAAPGYPSRVLVRGPLDRARRALRAGWRLARTHLRRDVLVVD